jgi:hypothetical protein
MICRQTERSEEHASRCIWRLIYMKGCLIQSCTHRWKHLVYPLVRLTNHQLIVEIV